MSIELAGLCFTSASGLPFSHDHWLVALSYAVAAFASYSALDMAERMHRTAGIARIMWQGCAAAALGGGIWAMHFIAMLALTIDTPVTYDPAITLLSLVTSVAFVATGFRIIQSRRSFAAIAAAGVIVGLGVRRCIISAWRRWCCRPASPTSRSCGACRSPSPWQRRPLGFGCPPASTTACANARSPPW
ncbi:signalling protein N terminal repeat-containing protein [Azospirillum oryzae]|uniref:Signalling protein N terminal repeat-containing protein n=1 Tax=Azospirillum oryzae TaxID=286727 RepID=A0A1X7EQ00_9PROT|nr:MHYT domain-containing protein [Azospirillum oryzae]SMF37888.1 signalling protein N terminal repeat-containing protein [Azospirillum oryzae]